MLLLNSQQQKALEGIDKFISSKHEKIFILEGFAGTGKTTVITTLISSRKFFSKEIVMAATTNKAVSVLQNMFGNQFEHVDFKTIHKLCKIKRQISTYGDVFFNLNDNPDDHSKQKSVYFYDIIIIDECSMISKKILSILTSLSQRIKGKIIFIGDKYQLPPVNEPISDVFDLPVKKMVLEKIVRCTDDVVKFSENIRKSIDTGGNISTKSCKGDNFKTFKTTHTWIGKYIENFDVTMNNVLLAYTNKRCREINNYIRNKIYGALSLQTYIENEIIVFNSFYKATPLNLNPYLGGGAGSDEPQLLSMEPISVNPSDDTISCNGTIFYTSQKAIIKKCRQVKIKMPSFPFEALFNLNRKLDLDFAVNAGKSKVPNKSECPICMEKIRDVDVAQLNCNHVFCRKCIKTWLEQNDMCPYCRMKVDESRIVFDDDEELTRLINNFKCLTDRQTVEVWELDVISNKNNGIVYTLAAESAEGFNEIRCELKAVILKIKKHLDNKTGIKEKKFFVVKRLWEFFYYCYIDLFAEISYGYCITVHKSQGSTFDDVYVDCNNIMQFKNNDTLNCLYTAITRSSKVLYMLV